MLDYVKFESNGFSFEHPSAWQPEGQPGFTAVVAGPGMLRVYFSVTQSPPEDMSAEALIALIHALVPSQTLRILTNESVKTEDLLGISVEAEFIRDGDTFHVELLAVRTTRGARGLLAVVSPTTLLDAAGPVIRQILDSFAIGPVPWTKIKKSAETAVFPSGTALPDIGATIPLGEAPPVAAPPTPSFGEAAAVDPAAFVVTTIAGGSAGFRDGPSALAAFERPNGVTVDPRGTIYVADFGNHRIRKISPEGITSTLAGGNAGFRDEPGALAQFDGPRGIVYVNGYLYVADLNNCRIRRLLLDGTVKTFAGNGARGFADGMANQVQFDAPRALAADAAGNLYVADGARIRRVGPDGRVTTLAGGAPGYQDGPLSQAQFDTLGSITLDAAGNIYVADVGNHVVRKVSRNGMVVTLPTAPSPVGFLEPVAVAAAPDGRLYVADAGDFSIKCLFPDGGVAVVCGGARQGRRDGRGGLEEGRAEFQLPIGLALTKDTLYVTDRESHTVRTIRLPRHAEASAEPRAAAPRPIAAPPPVAVPPPPPPPAPVAMADPSAHAVTGKKFVPTGRGADDYLVTTLAGSDAGYKDGTGEAVRFNSPMGLCVDAAGTVYVADHFNHCIRGVTSDGMVLTLAGIIESGLKDEVGLRARFKGPLGIAVGPDGDLYVSDHLNGCIRVVSLKGEVHTLAGNGIPGTRDGQGQYAQFEGPKGIVVDKHGMILVADGTVIRRIAPDGAVTTIAGRGRGFRDGRAGEAAFGWPYALALDVEGNCYIADAANHAIRRLSTDGIVTTVFGLPGQKLLNFPSGIAVDATGVIYVSDTNNHRVLRLDPSPDRTSVTATVIAGSVQGTRNGRGADAQLNGPRGVGVGPNGELYVADSNAHRIACLTTASVIPAVPAPGPVGVIISDEPAAASLQPSGLKPADPEPEAAPVTVPAETLDVASLQQPTRISQDDVPTLETESHRERHPAAEPLFPPPEPTPVQPVELILSDEPKSAKAEVDYIDTDERPSPAETTVPTAPPVAPLSNQRLPTQIFGWGLELTGTNTVRTEADGALYLNTCADAESSAFFFRPWEVSATQEIAVEARMQLIDYTGDRAHTGCAIWVENDRHADALLIQPEGISLLRAPDLFYAFDPVSEPHTYTIITDGPNIMVMIDGRMCLNGTNRFWLRSRAKSGGGPSRRWLAFGDGSSEAGSESRWFFVRYEIRRH